MPRLTLARLKPRSNVLGPGCRAIIWFHGCSQRCPHCIAKEMNEAPPWAEFSPEELAAWIGKISGIDGLTLSGGEPFEQDAESLQSFLTIIRRDFPHLSIMCYTGKKMEELLKTPYSSILHLIDILVDGPYIHELNNGQMWRGSSNQNIYAFSENFQQIVENVKTRTDRGIEVSLTPSLRLEITGIPKKGFMERLEEQLNQGGYFLH